jgi:hypothetical protein
MAFPRLCFGFGFCCMSFAEFFHVKGQSCIHHLYCPDAVQYVAALYAKDH